MEISKREKGGPRKTTLFINLNLINMTRKYRVQDDGSFMPLSIFVEKALREYMTALKEVGGE